ncbi:MAG: A/G-specific adenine glycosylase [Bacteroidota bacterium]|nr:A/G-specific adenine glycosylase [Bacteroidota bacterium]
MHSKDTIHLPWMRQRLRRWFAAHRRDLPWRRVPRQPYHVLVAEIMLQQTQVWRVEPAFERFIERFPTIAALAAAPRAEVLRAWQGLGYNRRAVFLHECATVVCQQYNGVIPPDYAQLRSLPGVGDYTARAILAFAYEQDVAVVDVNVHRVLSRFFELQATEADLLPLPTVHRLAAELLPRGGARWWNEALMDLGSLVCVRRSPRCAACPLARCCASANSMQPAPRRQRQEPTYRGLPRRLWRGKLVELLRQRPVWTLQEIACALFGTPTSADLEWLEALALGLHRDGLVSFRQDGRVGLPSPEEEAAKTSAL